MPPNIFRQHLITSSRVFTQLVEVTIVVVRRTRPRTLGEQRRCLVKVDYFDCGLFVSLLGLNITMNVCVFHSQFCVLIHYFETLSCNPHYHYAVGIAVEVDFLAV